MSLSLDGENRHEPLVIADCRLLAFDPDNGIVVFFSRRSQRIYAANIYADVCNCPGFAAHRHCRHISESIAWRLAWASTSGESSAQEVYDDFMEAGLLPGERETIAAAERVVA